MDGIHVYIYIYTDVCTCLLCMHAAQGGAAARGQGAQPAREGGGLPAAEPLRRGGVGAHGAGYVRSSTRDLY